MIKNFKNYIADVKSEAKKVSWLNKKETMTTSVSVFFVVTLFACFFLLVDLVISNFINYVLNI
ncbi:MAG: preprotein translocase subunit SecE [Rickettsiales bacterium]|nr:preprotein translocase subunit SecE [Rickettsiales bacterium]